MTRSPSTSLEQLKNALDAGHIDRATFDVAVAGIGAKLEGGGAIAQGQGALAVGAGGVVVAGNSYGDINTGVIIQLGTRPGASKEDLRRAYLARILIQADQLPLFASDGAQAQIKLSSVYTALLTQRSEGDGGIERAMPGTSPERAARRLSALDVLNAERNSCSSAAPAAARALSPASSPCPWRANCSVPPARTSPRSPRPCPGKRATATTRNRSSGITARCCRCTSCCAIWPASCRRPARPSMRRRCGTSSAGASSRRALDDFAPHLREHLLERGGLVLLDGLDEVPDADNRRVQIKQAVQDFAATFSKCRFLVTSRTYAYQRQDWKLDGFAEVHLLPFTPGQIDAFVDAWYAHMVRLERLPEAAARDRAGVLKRAAGRNRHVRELAEHPLLLTLIAKVQTEKGGTLPEKREELYQKAVDMLLNEWENMKVRLREDGSKDTEPSLAEWLNASRDDIRKQLNRLAFEAHRDQPKLSGTADIRQKELIAALLEASENRADVKVKRLEEYLRDRAGILAAHGVGMYQFPHRSFQEYLAACHLTDDEFPDKLADLARSDANRWREVVLLAGAKAAGGSMLNAWALAESLCPAPPPDGAAAPEADHWGALLAGQVLVECADLSKVAKRDADKLARVREWQRAIMRRNTLPAVERALAGRTLAVLGDPRPEVMSLDGMHFCYVPPGPFVMGSREDESTVRREKPQHTVDLNYPFFIARFPLTVAQWREYLQCSGNAAEDQDSLRGRANDPVVRVSWHEALRFCDFLTQAWRRLLPARLDRHAAFGSGVGEGRARRQAHAGEQ